MRRVQTLGLLMLVLASVPAFADKASSAYRQGEKAEVQGKSDLAFQFYKQAHDLRPKDPKYNSAYMRLRFQAGTEHVQKGQKLRDEGKLQEALAEFQRATEIDTSSFIAFQEAHRTQELIEKGSAPVNKVVSPLTQMLERAEGPVELKPASPVPITLRITENTKVIYTTIGKLAGINVLFDPDYNPRKISIELNGVTLNEALGIVAIASKTFWRPVTPNTIFVAADSSAKRKELEQSVIKTFYLANVSNQTDLQDAVNTIRQILDITRVQQVQSQNAIVIRGTPDQLILAEKLLNDIDKAKAEVVIDVKVMEVSRDRVRTLGTNVPTSSNISLVNNSTTSGAGTGSGSSTFTLNQLSSVNANNLLFTIGGWEVTFLASDSNTKLIQNPQIRALDNQKATLKIGERVPVATGSFQPGIGGVGINPLVNTQFQYLDVGVNIDITPRIHAGHEVTLKISMEVSSVVGNENIGGISQPIIGQRRIDHETRVKEGDANLIAGLLSDTESQSISGYPWLIKIPILKYLFGQEATERHQNEIVFAITPHIVRAQDVTEQNLRPIDVGTSGSIELRRESPSPPPTAAPPTSQGPAQPAQPGQAAQPAQTPAQRRGAPPAQPPAQQGTAAAPPTQSQVINPTPVKPPPEAADAAVVSPSSPGGNAGLPVLHFEPASLTQTVGNTFVMDVTISGVQNVYSVPLQLNYDPKILQLLNVSNGPFLGRDGQPVALVHRDDNASGTLQMTGTRSPGASGVGGSGSVFTLTFMAKAAGQSLLNISRASALDPSMQPTSLAGSQALVTVK